MSVENSKPNSTEVSGQLGWKRPLLTIIGAILLVGILGSLYFYFSPRTPHYEQFEAYQNTMALEGNRFSVEHPTSIKLIQQSDSDVVFQQAIAKNDAKSTVFVTSFDIGEEAASQLTDKLKNDEAIVEEMKQWATTLPRVGQAKDTVVSKATDFTSSQSNAVLLQYHYQTQTGKDGKVEGAELIVVGKQRLYILDVSAPSHVWIKNQSAWQRVINSFKVDQ